MKLLYVQIAKVTSLFDTRLINPSGLSLRDFFAALKDRYGFAKSPIHEYDRSDKGSLVFEGGVFFFNGASVSVGLSIFNDGIVGQTSSGTDATLAFLEDLRTFATERGLQLPDPSTVKSGFVSVLVVETKSALVSLNPKLESIIKFIEAKVQYLDGKPRTYDVGQIGILTEDNDKPFAPAMFKFERRAEQPFELNRYYSQAPLQTRDHIALLEILEEILKG